MRYAFWAILVGLALSACGTSEVTEAGNATYFVSAQELLVAGGWSAAQREAIHKGTAYCAAKGGQFVLMNEGRSGTPGFTPLTSEIKFSCGSNGAPIREANAQCANDMQSSELDPIRTKVEVLRPDPNAPAPFAMATNDTFSTPLERHAIERWAAIREECEKRTNAATAMSAAADPLQAVIIQKDRAFWADAAGRVSLLVVALYQGKLTYGEFAEKRYEISRDAATAERDFRAATLMADRERQLQMQELAAQQFQTRLAVWSRYAEAVASRQPQVVHVDGGVHVDGRVRVQTNCTSSRIGSFVDTSCN